MRSFHKEIDYDHANDSAVAAQNRIYAHVRADVWRGVSRRDEETQWDVQLICMEITGEKELWDE